MLISKLQTISKNLISEVKLDLKRSFYDDFDLEKFGPTAIV
jgi:hypothetical protein